MPDPPATPAPEEGGGGAVVAIVVSCSVVVLLGGFPYEADETNYWGPTLFIGGEESDYLAEQHHDAVCEYFPLARIEMVQGAGHWVHQDHPKEFGALVHDFVTSV